MRIKPGIGLDEVVFGMSRDDVMKLIGEAEEIKTEDHGEGEQTVSWYFWQQGVSYHFEMECDWRLTRIEVSSPKALLMSANVIGFSRPKLRRLFEKKRTPWAEEEVQDGVVYCEDWDMTFWSRNGTVESVQFEVPIDEDDHYVWPDSSPTSKNS